MPMPRVPCWKQNHGIHEEAFHALGRGSFLNLRSSKTVIHKHLRQALQGDFQTLQLTVYSFTSHWLTLQTIFIGSEEVVGKRTPPYLTRQTILDPVNFPLNHPFISFIIIFCDFLAIKIIVNFHLESAKSHRLMLNFLYISHIFSLFGDDMMRMCGSP